MAVCEKGCKFAHLYEEEPAIDKLYQISAGKYRRYSGRTKLESLVDVSTTAKNLRDIGRTIKGFGEARKLLKSLKPAALLIKGGFVAVPMGKAAASLGIPYLTHDSDSTPGLANRLIAKNAIIHATGMPADLYPYPGAQTRYTGIPVSADFEPVNDEARAAFREQVGLSECKRVVCVIGGSQGGERLNHDFIWAMARLMQADETLGVIHIAGPAHTEKVGRIYDGELLADERRRVVVKGFVPDVYRYTGAADVVVSRASATAVAELAIQSKALVLVPGRLAGAHQDKNAAHLVDTGAALSAAFGDREGLYAAIKRLLDDAGVQASVSAHLHELAKPAAARELAELTLEVARGRGPNGAARS